MHILDDLSKCGIRVVLWGQSGFLVNMKEQPMLIERIRVAQKKDSLLLEFVEEVKKGNEPKFRFPNNDILRFGKRICVLNADNLWRKIFSEAHESVYSVHPRKTKTYHGLKNNFWWRYMKNAIVEYVSECLVCQQVKIEH